MPITLQEASVSFGGGPPVLDGASLTITPSDRVAIVAPSGSGKTTLLTVLGLLRKPNSGRVLINDQDPWRPTTDRSAVRAALIAWVLQTVNLLPHRTVVDNVALAAIAAGADRPAAVRSALSALSAVGLRDLRDRPAKSLSGGEAQRVGVARGLCGPAQVLLADEPTANLDQSTRDVVAEALFAIPGKTALVVATHDLSVAERADRVFTLKTGSLVPSRRE